MPWITSNVFKQALGESLLRLPSFDGGSTKVCFRHVVHFYRDVAVPENTDVQHLTFETILEASRVTALKHRVTPIAVTFPEDIAMIPRGFVIAAPIERVITDLATFAHHRPLPLLFDIINRGAEVPGLPGDGEEFFILTNSDIHLQPNFYLAVGELIAKGYDVITINRRTIYADPGAPLSELMLAEHGGDHPGFDCFVFPTCMLSSFVQSRAACGGGHPMRSLLFNLVAHANRFLMIGYAHLTFHIGDSTYFMDSKFDDYVRFNIGEAQAIVDELAKNPEKAKLLTNFITVHESKYQVPTAPAA